MRYVVLLPGDESRWAAASAEEKLATYARHGDFAQALAARGHTITGGAELTRSTEAKVVRAGDGAVTVTDGPYAETVEQLTGYYEVESDDLDDLLEVVAVLAQPDGAVEVRRVVTDEERAS
ncbi:YciI family protein [Phycicoccus avicenniae]|uniref:YciI family protein n=1 Tax=Phycicoccus avicenniae TaxID=2828860 RepID=UPI003D2B777E